MLIFFNQALISCIDNNICKITIYFFFPPQDRTNHSTATAGQALIFPS